MVRGAPLLSQVGAHHDAVPATRRQSHSLCVTLGPRFHQPRSVSRCICSGESCSTRTVVQRLAEPPFWVCVTRFGPTVTRSSPTPAAP